MTPFPGFMQRDDASAKMAYDAQCERWREVWAWLTAGWPEMQDECYVRGYWRGLDIAIRFNPVHLEPDVPAELDGTHAESWTRGYEDGDSHGQAFRIILLRRSDIGSHALL